MEDPSAFGPVHVFVDFSNFWWPLTCKLKENGDKTFQKHQADYNKACDKVFESLSVSAIICCAPCKRSAMESPTPAPERLPTPISSHGEPVARRTPRSSSVLLVPIAPCSNLKRKTLPGT